MEIYTIGFTQTTAEQPRKLAVPAGQSERSLAGVAVEEAKLHWLQCNGICLTDRASSDIP